MICKNCKYYYENTIEFVGSTLTRQEGKCSNPLISDDSGNYDGCPDNGIYATCDEQRGDLIVGPNFGCIHFEKKL
jgi:hypothetical protein